MIDPSIRRTLLDALHVAKGDDLERARRAFRGCTPEQMRREHGASGRTRQQILDEYQAHRDRIAVAEAWVESQP